MSVTLNNTIGSLYVGIVFSAVLFGITNVQSYNYYIRYPNDWKLHKISVGVLWMLDSLHLALSIHLGYYYLIDSFGNLFALEIIVWSLKAQIAINVVIILLVQSLYAVRVWKLGTGHHDKIIPSLVTFAVASGYALGIVLAVFTYRMATFSQIHEMSWAIEASFISSTSIDFIISATMVHYLLKSKSGFARTSLKVSTLIQYTVGSGLVTSACSLSALVTYLIMPNNLIFMAIEYSLTKLYINSLLAMLNARKTIRGKNEDGLSISLTDLRSGSSGYPSPGGMSQGSAAWRKMSIREIPRDPLTSGDSKVTFVWPPQQDSEV